MFIVYNKNMAFPFQYFQSGLYTWNKHYVTN